MEPCGHDEHRNAVLPPPGHKAEATRLIQAALTEIELARRAFR
jgi:hypothetical protein